MFGVFRATASAAVRRSNVVMPRGAQAQPPLPTRLSSTTTKETNPEFKESVQALLEKPAFTNLPPEKQEEIKTDLREIEGHNQKENWYSLNGGDNPHPAPGRWVSKTEKQASYLNRLFQTLNQN